MDPPATEAGETGADAPLPLWPFLAALSIAALGAGAFLWRRALRKRRIRALNQGNANKAILAAGKLALSMLRFAGCGPMDPLQTPGAYAEAAAKQAPGLKAGRLQRLLELAQQARFSGKACTKQERSEAAALVRALQGRLKPRLPKIRRILFDWLYPPLF